MAVALEPAQVAHIKNAQLNFLRRGGIFEMPLAMLRAQGVIDEDYVYREYPKIIRISRGMQTLHRSTKDCENKTLTWDELKEVFDDIFVNSEEEEERVLSGGQTSAQLEDARQGLLQRCRTMGIPADPTWSAVRLRRELGDALDAPAPGDAMAKLEAELASLKKMAAMQAEIEALRAALAAPPLDEMRSELTALGVKVDGRWSAARLREELERATSPHGG